MPLLISLCKFGGLQLFCVISSWPADQAFARIEKACENISPTGHGNKLMNHLAKKSKKRGHGLLKIGLHIKEKRT